MEKVYKKTVVLFRSPDLPNEFSEELTNYYSIYCVPVLSFTYKEYESNLLSVNYEEYEAVVFPSQRAVMAVHLCLSLPPSIKILVVGESTAKSCVELLHRIPDIIGAQGAKELSFQIIQASFKKLVYLCGDNQSTLPYEEFKQANIDFIEVCCYGTREVNHEELTESLRTIPPPDFCVFFSPSGVQFIFNNLAWNWPSIKLISIGKTTAEALIKLFGKCDGVPEKFNLNGIKDLLLSYL